MNTIRKITLDFQTERLLFARTLYGSWENFFSRSIERIADEVLSRYDRPDEHLVVESLRLDLGTIGEETFYDDFPRLFRNQLDETLSQLEQRVRSGEVQAAKATLTDDAFSLLTLFLLHGRIDPVQLARYGNLNTLFLSVIRQSGKRFASFLRTYGHYTGLQERIVRQFDEKALETGVRLLQPGEGAFICSYVRFLYKRYAQPKLPAVTRSVYRYAVWRVVYAYLLGNRSSYFNRKSFLIQTLVSIAIRLNSNFVDLTALLADEIPESPDGSATLPEFLALLREIHRENRREEIHRAAFDPHALYRIIGETWKQPASTKTAPSVVCSLVGILSREESLRTFLRFLNEEEIIRLVPLVIPGESAFVIAYARELERNKEKGAFQGRAGGEFSTLKWVIIFPLLLKNRGTAFNRKWFVKQVLTRIAAHHNLSLKELLAFLSEEKYIRLVDRELAEIFHSLAMELSPETKPGKQQQPGDPVARVLADIRQTAENTVDPGKKARTLQEVLSNDLYRKALIERTTDLERERLLALLIPEDKEYILSYAQSLIGSVNRDSVLSGKTTGGFDRLVWFFIFGLLTEKQTTRFNRHSFARRTLHQLSSHYNLDYADLLTTLYCYSEATRLPESIGGVIRELYREEQQVWLTHALSVPEERTKEQLLQQLCPGTADFVREFFRLLERFFQTDLQRLGDSPEWSGLKNRQTLLPRFQHDKWKWLFRWLFAHPRSTIRTQELVREFLKQLCRQYRIDRIFLEQGIRRVAEQISGSLPANVWATVCHLLPAYPNKHTDRSVVDGPIPAPNRVNIRELSKQNNAVFTENAGVVLLAPFLPSLFRQLHLIDPSGFTNDEERIRAMFLIQYAVYGEERTTFGEHELLLNKALTGFSPAQSVPVACTLTDEERETVVSLLQGVLQHWSKLKNTSVTTLRETFLQREGKLEEKEGMLLLTVAEKAYDLLLDSLPWNFRTVKFPWMEQLLTVSWR